MEYLKILQELRANSGNPITVGLSDDEIQEFVGHDKNLQFAIEDAVKSINRFPEQEKDLLKLDEKELIPQLQEGILNFYSPDSVSPYVPLASKGPWIITTHGAVVFDTGGYGMLGLGHDPDEVSGILAKNHTMANVMTPSFYQRRFIDLMKSKIGMAHNSCPYEQFCCLNSGSEAMAVAARISNAHAKIVTDPGAKHEGKKIVLLSNKGAFHGRTFRPASASDSTMEKYRMYLATFRDSKHLLTVEPNSVESIREVFAKAESDGLYIEAFFLEPVMGEGNPGVGVTREFYDEARRLTKEHDALLIIDSIQAGLRAHGCLSIVDYPGFEDAEPPDMESFSKALNAGQYPLSVLGLTAKSASYYKVGLYGNTMTTNARALDVACAVLEALTPELSQNIRERGAQFLSGLNALKEEMPEIITKVAGTGLLLSAELAKDKFPVTGFGGVEEYMRHHGVNVIHGGKNALRFTPYFKITSREVDLLLNQVRNALKHFANS